MNDALEKICVDLKAFQDKVSHLDAEEYDVKLRTPAWGENNTQDYDYARNLLGNAGKFLAHVDMLEHVNSIIDDVDINKNILKDVSKDIVNQLTMYLDHYVDPKDNELGRNLMFQLDGIDKILNNFSRVNDSNNNPGAPSPK